MTSGGYKPDVEPEAPEVKRLLEPGDRLQRDLLDPVSRQILLPGGTPLTKGFIRKITALGLVEDALRCVVRDFDARRQAAADAARGVPFEYALYVEGKETVRALLDAVVKPELPEQERREVWKQATSFVSTMLDKMGMLPLEECPDLRVYDIYMHSHPLNTAILASTVGLGLQYPRQRLHELALAALFSDLGKARLPSVLLYKPGKLSESELERVRKHVEISADFAGRFRWAHGIVSHVAASHHERWNGTGYPRGLAGRAITEEISIVGIVDAYDAMISDVPYRKRMEPAIAYRLVTTGDHFDPAIVEAFKRRVVPYPRGTSVKLSTGVEARVLRVPPDNPYRPLVDADGKLVDLAKDPSVRVVSHLIPRRFMRQKVHFEVVVTNPGGLRIAGRAVDLSLGGVCIEAAEAPPLGEGLVVQLVAAEVALVGYVLWIRHGEAGKLVFALSAIPASDPDRERLMDVLLEASGVQA